MVNVLMFISVCVYSFRVSFLRSAKRLPTSAVGHRVMFCHPMARPSDTEPPNWRKKESSSAPEYYNYPVAGQEILNGFSNGDPVYNMTMDDWRTHDGLDIGAEKGQNVMSIGAGTVVDSYEDIMWGNVLVIQHGDIEVRYCGLTDKSLLAAGDTVEDGQILGTVGTIPIEEKLGAHLHIQMKKEGVWIDPTRVLKEAA